MVTTGVAANERVVVTGQMPVRARREGASRSGDSASSDGSESRCERRPLDESLRALHPPSGDDRRVDGLRHSLRTARVFSACRSAICRRSIIRSSRCNVNYPGATPETMANNVATPLERQFMQIPGLELVTSNNGAGAYELRPAVRSLEEPRCSGHRRAGRDHPAHRAAAGRSAEPADLHQDEPERSADHVSRAARATRSPKASCTTTPTPRSASASASCPASARWRCSARSRRYGSRPIPRRWPSRNITMDDLTAAIKNGTSYTGAGQFDGAASDVSAAATRRN